MKKLSLYPICIVVMLSSVAEAQVGRSGKARRTLEVGDVFQIHNESGWLTLKRGNGDAIVSLTCKKDGELLPVKEIHLTQSERRYKEQVMHKKCQVRVIKGGSVKLQWASRWERH